MYKLEKPYTTKQYADFVVEYNHIQGLTIEETENTVYALHPWEIIQDGKIVDISEQYAAEQVSQKEKMFAEQFFYTSLGYVKRTVTMKDGSNKDFLSDILPLLQVDVPIITYNKPDFFKAELPSQNLGILVTAEFINECKQQVLTDFYGASVNFEGNENNVV